MPEMPAGTITFLFADIEGSTRLWEQEPDGMRAVLARHDSILRHDVEAYGGIVFKTAGDSCCAAFPTAHAALEAAISAQKSLRSIEKVLGADLTLKVRMAIHTGAAEARDGDYFGQPLNRTARLLAAGHGGQILMSSVSRDLCQDTLPAPVTLLGLGEHRLRDLTRPECIFQVLHPDLGSKFPALKTLNNPVLPNNLPEQVTSFVGRERELADIRARLETTRMFTLTGTGGCGKTRLTLQVAADLLDRFPDGVWFVEFAALTDSDLVPQAVAETLSIREGKGESVTKTLTVALHTKRLLIVLDNCEHVLEPAARLAEALLRSCPGVSILASSREALGISGEHAYRVPSLSLPDLKQKEAPETLSQYESVRLFIERAVAAKSDFSVNSQNAAALASICHRLDGIPFAIELAAARVRSMTVEELEKRLSDRFRILTGGSRTALPRQQTLRALLEWSYDMLDERQKALLYRLSVFSGGWTLEACENVCAGEPVEEWEVMDLLTAMCDKSLVVCDEQSGQTRYRLLETMRQYNSEKLAASGDSLHYRCRHRDYYSRLAANVAAGMEEGQFGDGLEQLEREHDNLRSALTFCLDETDGSEASLRLGASLQAFWWTRGYFSEGRQFLASALSRPSEVESTARADALNAAGTLAWMLGDHTAAQQQIEESLRIRTALGDRSGIAGSLLSLGHVARVRGELVEARAYIEQGLDICREIGSAKRTAVGLFQLGNIALTSSDFATARALYTEALAILKTFDDPRAIATCLMNLGHVSLYEGDLASARSLYEQGAAICREIKARQVLAQCLNGLANLAFSEGDTETARRQLQENLTVQRDLGDTKGIAVSLGNLGSVAYTEGDYQTARSLLEESLAGYRACGMRTDVAGILVDLARVSWRESDHSGALSTLREALGISVDADDRAGIAIALDALADVFASIDRPDVAARLLGSADRLRDEIGAPRLPNQEADVSALRSALRAAIGEESVVKETAIGRNATLDEIIASLAVSTAESGGQKH